MKIRFNPEANLLVVTALVEADDGLEVVRLALDTGANFTTLNLEIFENLGVKVPSNAEKCILATANGFIESPIVQVESLTTLGISHQNFSVVAHSLPESLDIDGVLGLNFLRGRRLTLDFIAGEMELI